MRLFQYPGLVEPILPPAVIPFSQAVYPDYFDARRQTDGDFENIFPVITVSAPTYFSAIYPDSFDYRIKISDTETIRDIIGWQEFDGLIFPEYPDYLIVRSQNIPDNQSFIYVAPVTINLKNWDVEYPELLLRKRDDSYFPFIGDTRGPVIPTGVANKLSLIEFYNLRIRLDVKKAVDSGVIAALSTDVTGTPVSFNKAFKDVDSIVLTVQETANFQTVVDFVDIPNPTGFSVYVFNAAGVRVSKTVYWVARGII